MSRKLEHLEYLEQKGEFNIACSQTIFSQEEISHLKQYGHWFQGLTNGDLKPFTVSQKSFVKVFTEQVSPASEFEILWFKYLGRLKLEKEHPEGFKKAYSFKEQSFYTREDYYTLHPDRRNRY